MAKMRRCPSIKKRFVFVLLMIGLMLASFETGLRIASFFLNFFESKNELEIREYQKRYLWSPFSEKKWAKKLFEETWESLSTDYSPPSWIWVGKEYHGEYVNITEQGLRKTWNPEQAPSKSLYIFGGSAIWGSFARDDATIPSTISKILFEAGHPVEVHNYGQSAYRLTNEIIHLILLLKEGHRPDYVIFYDGANDLLEAYHNGRGDIEQPEKTSISSFLKNHFVIYKTGRRIVTFFSHDQQAPEPLPPVYSEQQLQLLSADVVKNYSGSLEFLDTLSQAHGFKSLFFWQPLVFNKNELTQEEHRVQMDPRFNYEELAKLYQYVNDTFQSRRSPHFLDLSKAFKNETKTIFLDYCHLTEEGNKIVAEKIAERFLNEIR